MRGLGFVPVRDDKGRYSELLVRAWRTACRYSVLPNG
jgi:hypothetical protein